MSEMKHTPLPWRVGYRATDIGCENAKIGGYAKLFDVRGWGYLTGQGHGALGLGQDEACAIQEANAEFVVTACNSHYDNLSTIAALKAENERLREALERTEPYMKDLYRAICHGNEDAAGNFVDRDDLVRAARAALTKQEG